MLGFGELFAHEAAFRLGWGGTKVIAFLILHLPLFFPFVVVYSSFFGTKGVPHRLDATHHLPEFVLAMHDADQPSIRSFQCHEGRIQSDQGLRFEKTLWRGEGENSWMAWPAWSEEALKISMREVFGVWFIVFEFSNHAASGGINSQGREAEKALFMLG
jgi:hypothetical protein